MMITLAMANNQCRDMWEMVTQRLGKSGSLWQFTGQRLTLWALYQSKSKWKAAKF
jgi:hypothetical protein